MMRRLLLLGLVVVLALAAFPTRSHAASTVTSPSTAAAKKLYQQTWAATKLKGWSKAGSGWKVSNGIVSFSSTGVGELLAPFATTKYHDFRVSATIEDKAPASQQDGAFGLEVRVTSHADGILGGFFFSSSQQFSEPMLVWNDQSVGQNDTALPAGKFNTFRMDIHGTDVTLYINGKMMVQFSIPDITSGPKVGFWSEGRAMQVKSFTISKLAGTSALPSLPPVMKINLGSTDVPSALPSQGGHFYTNEEYARQSGLTNDAVTAQGRLIGHEADYYANSPPSSGPYALFADVDAFNSPAAAQKDLAANYSGLQKQVSTNASYSATDVTGLGDVAHVVTYDFTDTGYSGTNLPASAVAVVLTQGSYEVAVFEYFVRGTVPSATMTSAVTALATTVAKRAATTTTRA